MFNRILVNRVQEESTTANNSYNEFRNHSTPNKRDVMDSSTELEINFKETTTKRENINNLQNISSFEYAYLMGRKSINVILNNIALTSSTGLNSSSKTGRSLLSVKVEYQPLYFCIYLFTYLVYLVLKSIARHRIRFVRPILYQKL